MAKLAIPRQISNIAPKGKGIVQNAASGIGTTAILQTLDNFAGGPFQRLGFVLPGLNVRISAVDAIVYMIHAGGLKLNKKGVAAVGAAKLISGGIAATGLTALGSNINLPGSPTSSSGPTGGGI